MTVEERIAQLEEQVRMLMACVTKQAVVSEKFILVDSKGKQCGEWSAAQSSPMLSMDGPKGGAIALGFVPSVEGEARAWLSGPGNMSYILLEAREEWSKMRIAAPPGQREAVECFCGYQAAEVTLSFDSKVRARLATGAAQSHLDVIAHDGIVKTFSNP